MGAYRPQYVNMYGEWRLGARSYREAECIITSTTMHMTIPSVFEALGLDGKIAMASSVFVVASTIFFSVGFLCGHFCQKKMVRVYLLWLQVDSRHRYRSLTMMKWCYKLVSKSCNWN